jgi:hypothetical protein
MLFDLLENAKQMTLDEIADEVKFLINGWFYNHILVADFDYVPSVKAAAVPTTDQRGTASRKRGDPAFTSGCLPARSCLQQLSRCRRPSWSSTAAAAPSAACP